MAEEFPELTYLESLGSTVEERDVWAMHITDESVNMDSKKVIVINAGLIAR
jgi:hypothetical protein